MTSNEGGCYEYAMKTSDEGRHDEEEDAMKMKTRDEAFNYY
jgi:hypothetical protein